MKIILPLLLLATACATSPAPPGASDVQVIRHHIGASSEGEYIQFTPIRSVALGLSGAEYMRYLPPAGVMAAHVDGNVLTLDVAGLTRIDFVPGMESLGSNIGIKVASMKFYSDVFIVCPYRAPRFQYIFPDEITARIDGDALILDVDVSLKWTFIVENIVFSYEVGGPVLMQRFWQGGGQMLRLGDIRKLVEEFEYVSNDCPVKIQGEVIDGSIVKRPCFIRDSSTSSHIELLPPKD